MFQFFRNKLLIGPTKRELIVGLICWVGWQLILPVALLPLLLALGLSADAPQTEFIFQISYFTLSFAMVALLFRNLLWRSLEPLRGKLRWLFSSVLSGFMLYYAVSYLLSWVIMLLPVEPDNRNNAAIDDLLSQGALVMGFCTVVLAPITEEVLVRGMIFAPLCKKSPILAYAATVLIFGGLHVIGYIGQQPWPVLLISFLQYLPASIALGYVYQRTGSVWTSIALHALVNGIAVSYLL